MTVAYWGQLLVRSDWFQILCQGANDFCRRSFFEPVLLGSAPSPGGFCAASRGGLGQIFADMKIVAQEGALWPKDFAALQPNPFGPIAQRVDLTVESAPSAAGTMTPAPAHLIHFTKGGGVNGVCLAQDLSCRQTYFFPIPRLFTLARAGRHRTNHASVRLGHHVLGSLRGQQAKRLLILFLKDCLSPLRILQRRLPHRTDSDLKTIVFQHSRHRVLEGMLAAKIGQYPLQSFGAAPRANRNGLRQQTQIPLLRSLPNSLTHADRTKNAPPLQRFFLRTFDEGSCCFNCSARVRSAWAAQLPMVVLPKRRSSSIKSPSTSSAVFTMPSLLVITKMLSKRAINSGCS